MTCVWHERGATALRFYGELTAADRAAFDAHLTECETCRAALDELGSVATAIAGRSIDTPPGGDWSGFMARLDQRLEHDRRRARWPIALKVAAMVTLVTAALLIGRVFDQRRDAGSTAPVSSNAVMPGADAVATLAEQHLQRSKLVLLGLATKDPQRARPADWRQERDLASAMLADTSQYRMAATERGLGDLADVLGDLEVVLLQTSLSDHADPGALTRIQNLIDRRDLLVKIEVIGLIDGTDATRRAGKLRLTRTGT